YFFLLFVLLRNHFFVPLKEKKEFLISLIKIIIASVISSFVGYFFLNFIKQIYSFSKVKNLLFGFTTSMTIALIVFVLIVQFFKIEEFKEVLGYFRKRFFKKNK
ncbi:MAG: hypothetical protein ACP5OX_01395, partial [Minisyncoccia bacterium]